MTVRKADGRHEKEEGFPWNRLFVDCVKGKRQPPLTIEDSHRSTVVSLLGNIAYHTRRVVSWDAKSEQILGDKEAAGMLSRARRHGFELPKVSNCTRRSCTMLELLKTGDRALPFYTKALE